jgi:hypothetical protein
VRSIHQRNDTIVGQRFRLSQNGTAGAQAHEAGSEAAS